ncbi:U32 family peptidase [Shewanella sp. SR44-3]|uniref:U32 family peptidase n=1 Tax=Shewanella sp. SR44-3 TaxID=2760936 RepID=UPI0015FADF04|nr:U32 family peptidase [Shewanella sp. SR44-3]MBB1270191.1 U32 family peptidase [Shewanella sp. SR44-3]
MKITLGPISYCWEKDKVQAFYEKAAQSQVHSVYLGETVCSRRREVKLNDYLAIARQLKAAGKEVILSTMALIEAQSEIGELRKYIDNGEFIIEANDMAAVHYACEAKLPFICGPSINNYNRASLDILHKMGMVRFVMPYELSKDWLTKVIENKPEFDIEVMGHGYMPLAHSARCFTAKHFGLRKDNCDTICKTHPKGMLAQTQEDQPLLRLNGIQTQSASYVDLISEIPAMQTLGVNYFRVSPTALSSIELADELCRTLAKQQTPQSQSCSQSCNGYWFNQAGFNQVSS